MTQLMQQHSERTSPRELWSHAFALSASDQSVDHVLGALSVAPHSEIFTSKIPQAIALGGLAKDEKVHQLSATPIDTKMVLHAVATIAWHRRIFKAKLGSLIHPSHRVKMSGRWGDVEPVIATSTLSEISGISMGSLKMILRALAADNAVKTVYSYDGQECVLLRPDVVDDRSVLTYFS